MTTYGIKPPESFDVHLPENWTKWAKRFEQFRAASGLSGAVTAKQVSTFLYCFGESAEDLLSAMGATDADRATYDGIKEKFDTYFKVRHNAVYERACFNRRIQQQGESAEDFIVAVHTMEDRCEFGADWRDELIRYRLVVGIRDSRIVREIAVDSYTNSSRGCQTDPTINEKLPMVSKSFFVRETLETIPSFWMR